MKKIKIISNEKLCCWLHSDLLCPRLLQKQKNPSILNVHLSEAQLSLNTRRESWEDIRHPRMLCPPGTGSWQNWELSMDQG